MSMDLIWVNTNTNMNVDSNFQYSVLYCSWTILFFVAFLCLCLVFLSLCLSHIYQGEG